LLELAEERVLDPGRVSGHEPIQQRGPLGHLDVECPHIARSGRDLVLNRRNGAGAKPGGEPTEAVGERVNGDKARRHSPSRLVSSRLDALVTRPWSRSSQIAAFEIELHGPLPSINNVTETVRYRINFIAQA